MTALTTIGFDADDTLWHNESYFRLTQDRFAELLADHAGRDHLEDRLLAAERRNLGRYGFGVKGFTLSMIETAVEVTGGLVSGAVVGEILAAGREMLARPVDLLPEAECAVRFARAAGLRLILITKGDLLDQERKLAQSGLGEMFDAVEIVSDKSAQVYDRIFARHGDGAARAMMVGNSLKSDVLPMLETGGWGVHVPYDVTWMLEHAEAPQGNARFHALGTLGDLSRLLESLR